MRFHSSKQDIALALVHLELVRWQIVYFTHSVCPAQTLTLATLGFGFGAIRSFFSPATHRRQIEGNSAWPPPFNEVNYHTATHLTVSLSPSLSLNQLLCHTLKCTVMHEFIAVATWRLHSVQSQPCRAPFSFVSSDFSRQQVANKSLSCHSSVLSQTNQQSGR